MVNSRFLFKSYILHRIKSYNMLKQFAKGNQHLLMLLIVNLCAVQPAFSQGFLRAEGTKIVNDADNNFIIRSIGTGNWMIQEGYMMKSTDAGINTQWQFRKKLTAAIGEARTKEFYDAWLANHFTHADVEAMKAWGFNSIRPALHYKWFTLPIEEEPVKGQQTWLEGGFEMLDNLISWCADNEMYVFLDMHGAPGGQGKNADISDYDASKPSLWESEDNKLKLIEIWKKIADRYKDNPWVGGYDLINEINWDFENSGNENGCSCTQNQPATDMFSRLIDAVREVDRNHIVMVSGNCWGNNYNGLDGLADLDDNLVYTFHKYWNYNGANAVNWITEKRERLNVPLWMSESGENSNTWFTNAVALFEANDIGWSWWPVKKDGINNVLRVKTPVEYNNLMSYWKSASPIMNSDQIFDAVMKWAEAHKIENCVVQKDVVDALIRQIYSYEAIPFKEHNLSEPIFFTDYDLGRNNVAYFDNDTANYHIDEGGTYTNWNQGWSYRNDGVDIEACSDVVSNGFNVGWTEPGEWMRYTVTAAEASVNHLTIRYAGSNASTEIRIEVNGRDLTPVLKLPSTGGWTVYKSYTVENALLDKGVNVIKVTTLSGGANLNYFQFSNPRNPGDVDLEVVSASTSADGKSIFLSFNAAVSSSAVLLASDFAVYKGSQTVNIESAGLSQEFPNMIELCLEDFLSFSDLVYLSYSGSSIVSFTQKPLAQFQKIKVLNTLPSRISIPGKVLMQNYYYQEGLEFENTQDSGNPGGKNIAYVDSGDYIDFLITVEQSGIYNLSYSCAAMSAGGRFELQLFDINENKSVIGTYAVPATGGWQTWRLSSGEASFNKGNYKLRIDIVSKEFNLSRLDLQFREPLLVDQPSLAAFQLAPNPCKDFFDLGFEQTPGLVRIDAFNIDGSLVQSGEHDLRGLQSYRVDTSSWDKGFYIIQIAGKDIPARKVKLVKM